MTQPFLIAHRVRGKSAFDIAIRFACPECQSYESVTSDWCEAAKSQSECDECERLGYWWIIPTSGHRAYPYFAEPLDLLVDWEMARIHGRVVGDMPQALPDHYPTRSEPDKPKLSLARLGLTQNIERRL